MVLSALIGAAASTVLCLPRFLVWEKRLLPVWYLEAIVFFGGFVLWAFVFAWHTEYTRRPVFMLKISPIVFTTATLVGVMGAITSSYFLDPHLRKILPEEFPADPLHWVASTLFALAFTDLFLLFAPYAWAMRLFRNEKAAMGIAFTLGIAVWLLKINSSTHALPDRLFLDLFLSRMLQGIFAVWLYSRGGVLVIWWMGLLIEARHLLNL